MQDSLEKLRAIPVFSTISKESLSSLSSLLREERLGKGQYVAREGESADAMYVLQSGEVEVRKVISRQPAKYKTLAILEPGDIFGEMAVFAEEFRSADVVVRKDSVLWKLDYNELFNIIDTDPSSGIKIFQVIITVLTARVKTLNNELATMYQLGKLLPSADDTEALTKLVFEHVIHSIEPADMGLLATLNKFNEEFDICRSTETIEELHIQYDDPIAAWMFEKKSALMVRDTTANRSYKNTFYSGLSFVASPLLHEDDLLGFILLSHPSNKNAFAYSHMILLSAVCSQVGARLSDLERKKEDTLKQRLSQGKLSVDL